MSSQQKRKQDDSAPKAVKKSKKRRRRDAQRSTDRPNYKEIVKENPLFEKYYKGQNLVTDAEWDQFMGILKQELPSTFRITGTSNSDAHCLRQCLQERFFTELHKIEVDGEKIPLPQPIPWYPDNLAWHVSLSKKFIRKSGLVKQFHNFLVKENEQGNISRQEAVSMIPPLLLDVLPNHKVLDMCAAPGSKTAQLIEFLHSSDTLDKPIPDGVVIANDADAKRCYMLVHQAKRLNSPCFMVTNHDASVFPQLYYHKDCGTRVALSYDRILCDVPCSGDGTLRKNPMIWQTWNSNLSTGLHKLQLRILTRGLELLAVNGRLVYSTCSFNPVENEAIIAAALKQCKGAVSLVDVSGRLKGLKRIPGLNTWKVLGKGGHWVDWSDDKDSMMPRTLVETMFPPVVEEADAMGLEKCIRILPHHQDTGGFFVAVLEKSDILPWQSKKASPPLKPTTTESQTDQPSTDGPTTLSEEQTKQKGEEQAETSEGQMEIKEEQTQEQMQLQDLEQQTQGRTQHTQIKEELTQMIEESTQAQPQAVEKKQPHEELQEQQTDTQKELVQIASPPLQANSNQSELPEATNSGSCAGLVIKPPAAFNLYHKRRQRGGCFKEDPYVFISPSDPDWKLIMEYYGFQKDFPVGQLLTRSEYGKKRNVYLTSPLVRELVVRNGSSVKIINTGIRVISRCPLNKASCPFRFSQEGTVTVLPFLSRRLVTISASDVKMLLQEPNPLLTNLSQLLNDSASGLGVGPVILRYYPSNSQSEDTMAGILQHPIFLSAWLAAKSCRLFVGRPDRYHYLVLLGMNMDNEQSLTTISGQGEDNEDEAKTQEDEPDDIVTDQCLEVTDDT